MTTAAILMVRDESDVIEATIRHLAGQVDDIIAMDNLSWDGTREILDELWRHGLIGEIITDDDPAYYQSRKMTWLADIARGRGHDWVIPCDADEMWSCEPADRPIREHLLSLAPDVVACRARLFHYLPSAEDDAGDPDPFRRIRWRLAEPSSLPKMACRLRPGLVIEAGNHGCTFGGQRPALVAGGLRVNHYSWRSESQFGRKIVNGARAYAATDLPEEVGVHWRMWGDPEAPDLAERAAAHFRQHFYAAAPPRAPGAQGADGLVYDPAVE